MEGFSFLFGIEYECLLVKNKPPHGLHGQIKTQPDLDDQKQICEYLNRPFFGRHTFVPKLLLNQSANSQKTWIVDMDITVFVNTTDRLYIEEQKQHKLEDPLYDCLFSEGTSLKFLTSQDVNDYLKDTKCIIERNEIISPPLTREEMNSTIQIFTYLISAGQQIVALHNSSSSTHVHYSFQHQQRQIDFRQSPELLFNICVAWYFFEPILMQLVAPWRRDENLYCVSMRESVSAFITSEKVSETFFMEDSNTMFSHFIKENLEEEYKDDDPNWKTLLVATIISIFQYGDEDDMDEDNARPPPSKFQALNLLNIVANDKNVNSEPIGTVEVRIKHGSNDSTEIINFINFFGVFLTRAMSFKYHHQYLTPEVKRVLTNPSTDKTIQFELLSKFMHGHDKLMNYMRDLPHSFSS